MKHGSLFSGIGGFDLAAEWMGWENVMHCEINPFGRQVLKYYWPNAISYEDITKTDFTIHRGGIDILTGGFPCQPFSMAGKRKGTEDERHLWPEMLRAIREIMPRWVVGENVSGITNWDGGVVFEQVQADLEAEGYEVQAYILPACGVNAPHRRDRVWFVAKNPLRDGCLQREPDEKRTEIWEQRDTGAGDSDRICLSERPTPDTDINIGREGWMHQTEPGQAERHVGSRDALSYRRGTWDNFPTQSPVRWRNDGISSGLVGITFSKHRNESIKAYGNAIVPQVCFMIFKTIQKYEK